MSNKKPKESPEQIRNKIIRIFKKKVKGRIPDSSGSNIGHDGKVGHWLEKQMGVKPNADNAPDLFGFEMKNSTKSKTSFGDWSADFYLYNEKGYFTENKALDNRNKFITIFGKSNPKKRNRYSWSGQPVPKIGAYNTWGQKLVVDAKNNILAKYSFSADKRPDKNKVPKNLQKENLILARWDAKSIASKLEKKFNKLGWFKCERDPKTGIYNEIVFGAPMNFKTWIADVKKGHIFFDSGMKVGSHRLYSTWRASNAYWKSLIKRFS